MVVVAAAVIFDFKDTLAFVAADGPSLREVASARGFVVVDQDEEPALTSDASSQGAFENQVRRDRRQALRAAGASDAEADQILEEVEAGRGELRLELLPEVAGVLEALRSAGLSLAVCSNWDWNLDRQIAALGIQDHFAVVTCSARCGFWKPHPAIFELTVRALGVDPSEVIFVGDNYRNDIEPAERAGMRGYHLHRRACDAACRWGGDSIAAIIGDLHAR
jgi:putative hydrolase of the HAD superfamily